MPNSPPRRPSSRSGGESLVVAYDRGTAEHAPADSAGPCISHRERLPSRKRGASARVKRMTSVETPSQREEAMAMGYRTFRVRLPTQPVEPGEFICPASGEAGRRLTCQECKACSGSKSGCRNANPVILFHGSSIAGNRTLRLYELTMARLQAEEGGRGRVPLATVN
jgi:hypothetical protein